MRFEIQIQPFLGFAFNSHKLPLKAKPSLLNPVFREQGPITVSGIIFVLISWCDTHECQTKPVELYSCEESQALIPYYVANQATVIRSRSHCTVTCTVSSCAGVRAWSTVSLYHFRVVNVKLAVQCCYNSHMSVVNVNGVCNMVKMDTFSFQMWCKLCTVKNFFFIFSINWVSSRIAIKLIKNC